MEEHDGGEEDREREGVEEHPDSLSARGTSGLKLEPP
jgi:hypothetical protein